MVAMLQQRALVGVVGASGAGKSSLIFGGLVPILRRSRALWTVVSMSPGRTPFDSLIKRIVEHCDECGANLREMGGISAQSPGRVGFLLRRHAQHAGGRLVLIVDHFEELFTHVSAPFERQAFATALLSAADDVHGPVKLVLSMRADFLARLAEVPALRDAVIGNLLPLGPPDETSIRRLICAPAAKFGYEFEPAVVTAILGSLRDEPAPLPRSRPVRVARPVRGRVKRAPARRLARALNVSQRCHRRRPCRALAPPRSAVMPAPARPRFAAKNRAFVAHRRCRIPMLPAVVSTSACRGRAHQDFALMKRIARATPAPG